MNTHQSLYKENSSVLSPRNRQRMNREFQETKRAAQRSNIFLSARNISLSPSPTKRVESTLAAEPNTALFTSTPGTSSKVAQTKLQVRAQPLDQSRANAENKENGRSTDVLVHRQEQAEKAHASRIAQAASKANSTNSLTRQEEFLMRYIKWKKSKAQQQSESRRPFLPPGVKPATANSTTSSFAPKGHQFKAPEGLKLPQAPQSMASSMTLSKHRRSIYTTVATPPKKPEPTESKKFPVSRKIPAMSVGQHKRPPLGAMLARAGGATNSAAKLVTKPLWSVSKVASEKQVPSTTVAKQINTKQSTVKATKTKKDTAKESTSAKTHIPSTFKQPALPQKLNGGKANAISSQKPVATAATTSSYRGGAIGKARQLQVKRITTEAPVFRKPAISKLSQKMKAKRPVGTAGATPSAVRATLKINRSRLFAAPKQSHETSVAATPTDGVNPFEAFVTSTRARPSSNSQIAIEFNQLADTISPVEVLVQKRQQLNSNIAAAGEPVTAKPAKKFNFIRHSVAGDTLMDISAVLSPQAEVVAKVETPVITITAAAIPAASVTELHPTLQSVEGFRRQLVEETERLLAQCDKWEAYKAENMSRLQETGGEDMIDVATGQTRLLTSKKFMQFKGLIDRCEAGLRGEAAVDDGSERTKPITEVDLEGFWSMLGLQVSNVERRFQNLERWRANSWMDPDEIQLVPTKKKSTKHVKKQKVPTGNVKPSTGLREMLRKMRQNQSAAERPEAGTGEILTPSVSGRQKARRSLRFNSKSTGAEVIAIPSSGRRGRRSLSGTPNAQGRVAVIVRDRKSFSPSPTIISIPMSARRASLMAEKQTSGRDSPKLSPAIKEFRRSLRQMQETTERSSLLKTALLGASAGGAMRRAASPLAPLPPCTPVRETRSNTSVCKSILKTPGTAKSKPKSVIFNEKLDVRKFKFTLENEDGSIDPNLLEATKENALNTPEMTQEQNEESRIYTLRTRKIRLRPSCEIIIPQVPQ